MPDQNFSGVEFQIYPTDYYTWGCPVFFLESPTQGGKAGITKLEPRERTRVYIGHYQFHSGSVELVLNTITGNVSPHYHVVFDNTLSTAEHTSKGTVPINRKNMVEEHSELAKQENVTLAK